MKKLFQFVILGALLFTATQASAFTVPFFQSGVNFDRIEWQSLSGNIFSSPGMGGGNSFNNGVPSYTPYAGWALTTSSPTLLVMQGPLVTSSEFFLIDSIDFSVTPTTLFDMEVKSYNGGRLTDYGRLSYDGTYVDGQNIGNWAWTAYDVSAVPEPISAVLLSSGLFGLFLRRRLV